MDDSPAHTAMEAVARHSYGRLIAFLAAHSGDVAGAEDALSEAFLAALKKWPLEGVPQKPEAWLLHAARNRLLDKMRHLRVRENAEPHLQQLVEAQVVAERRDAFPDERLKLLFVCAHPAIDSAVRTPLMLQTVLGIDAARIASAFLVSPAALSQRLVRAKNKIREAGIPFHVPDPREWPDRISFVLDAIYAAYTSGWESLSDPSTAHHPLAQEAIDLGRTLVQLMPTEPEAHGLLALMIHCEARREARFNSHGEFVPLDEQDAALWLRPMIDEAETHLRTAASYKKLGRFQLEAAIQSIHAMRLTTGHIDWNEIALLYEGLTQISSGIGSLAGRAVALAQAGNPDRALAELEKLPEDRITNYQPYWAARGHILHLLQRNREAVQAFTRAASLTDDPALRAHLFKKITQINH